MNMLPSDRYLCSVLGITEDEFIEFQAAARQHLKDNPIEGPVAGTETAVTLAIINLVIGVGSMAVSLLLKPSVPKQREAGQIKTTDISQDPRQSNTSFAPRYGFDSVQQVTKLGEIIPLVYADRTVSSTKIGGVRINMPLIWSQVTSFGTSQMLRAVFLASESTLGGMDNDMWALGSNSLKNYKFDFNTETQEAARATIYVSKDGGRIIESDRVFGRSGQNDERSNGGGSSAANSAGEVFRVQRGGAEQNDFCSSHKPTTSTTFGVYSLIGNDLVYKVNPVIRPAISIQTKPKTNDGRVQITCPIDDIQEGRREKMALNYSTRSGIIATAGTKAGLSSGTVTSYTHQTVSRGNYIRYKIFSDAINESLGPKIKLKEAKKGQNYKIVALGDAADAIDWIYLTGITGVAVGDEVEIIKAPLETLSLTQLTNQGKYRIEEFNTEANKEVSNGFGQRENYPTTDAEFASITNKGLNWLSTDGVVGSKFEATVTTDESITSAININNTNAGSRYKVETVGSSDMDKGWTNNEAGDFGGWARKAGVYGNLSVEDGDTRKDSVEVGDIFTATDAPTNSNYDGEVRPYYGPMQVVRRWVNGRVRRVISDQETVDIGDAVASRQKQYDQNLIVGEIYKIGTAYAVCVDRTDGPFISKAEKLTENGSDFYQDVTADFYVIEPGGVGVYPADHLNPQTENADDAYTRQTATSRDHILRFAQGLVTNTRPCTATEFGIKSSLGIRVNNLCNFRDARSFKYADESYCTAFKKKKPEDLDSKFHESNTITSSEERFSFFTIQYKDQEADVDGDWIELGVRFGVSSETQQAQFNYLRLEFPTANPKQRIFRFRPLSGYEVRNIGTNDVYILDARKSRHTPVLTINPIQTINPTLSEEIKCEFNGYKISYADQAGRFASRFSWSSDSDINSDYVYTTKIKDGDDDTENMIGLPTLDGSITVDGVTYKNYIDKYAKLAESFAYEEVNATAQGGPEHEIVVVNEIVPNSGTTPTYAGMALVGMNIRSSQEWNQFSQFSGYVKQGIQARRLRNTLSVGTVSLFPDILLDLLTNETYGMGKYIKDEMIDLVSFEESANFVANRGTYGYRFNGIIAESINLRQYAADMAALNLLFFAEINGVFTLKPYFATDGGGAFTAVDIKALFTVGNIVEDSYKVVYLTPEEREPIQVAVQYRQERASTDQTNEGMFSVVRSVLVREAGTAYAPFVTETLDMTDFCTTEEHAIDAAKFMIRMRRVPDHTITFQTTYEAVLSDISPGDYIKVALDVTDYDQYNNGVVLDDGSLISTQSLSDGNHTVYAWNPTSSSDPASTTLTVSGGGTTASPTGIVFTEIVSNQASRTYQIERITADQDGTFTIEALHMPVNNSGIPLVVVDFDSTDSTVWTVTNA